MTKARTNADNASADIQGVTAGTGLSGGGTSGTVTLTNDMATTIAAKGDLVVGTGNDTYAALTAGNSGDTLVADSSATTGLRWQGSTAAGKNRIINGAMDFWQRGTSFGPTASTGYFTADRWRVTLNANTVTWSQETSVVPVGFQYALKATAGTGGTTPFVLQYIESANCQDLAGKTVTVSGFYATSSSTSVVVELFWNPTFNADSGSAGWGSISTTTISTTASMPTSPQTAQFVVPSNAKSLALQIKTSSNLSAGATLIVTGIQLELGSVATAFSRAGGTLAGELAACQRYYQRITSEGDSYGAMTAIGSYTTTTLFDVPVQFTVPLRVQPTSVDYSNIHVRITGGGGTYAVTNISIQDGGPMFCQIRFTAGTATAGNMGWVQTANNSAGYLGYSAEL